MFMKLYFNQAIQIWSGPPDGFYTLVGNLDQDRDREQMACLKLCVL